MSPFGWHSSKTWNELFKIAKEAGHIISIHTDNRWGGSFEVLKEARSLTDKPILAKGIHSDDKYIKKAVACGADFVLVVGRLPNIYLEKCLIEPDSLEQLKETPKDMKIVWNSRDLKTGGLKPESFKMAREAFDGWLCQASKISKLEDIDETADAVFIGTHLPKLASELKKLRRD